MSKLEVMAIETPETEKQRETKKTKTKEIE
jgi:hypothetical protein